MELRPASKISVPGGDAHLLGISATAAAQGVAIVLASAVDATAGPKPAYLAWNATYTT
jgi:hypothetical protein